MYVHKREAKKESKAKAGVKSATDSTKYEEAKDEEPPSKTQKQDDLSCWFNKGPDQDFLKRLKVEKDTPKITAQAAKIPVEHEKDMNAELQVNIDKLQNHLQIIRKKTKNLF